MKHEEQIPFIIGVTGHRDIDELSIDFIKEVLSDKLDHIKKLLPNTPIFFLSPLAEGADRITAKIAIEKGCELIVPLPLEKEEYLKDFETSESKKEFEELFEPPSKHYFVGYTDNNTKENIIKRAEQYQKVGEHIASSCNLLIAIWDGEVAKDTNGAAKIGGTSQIVNYKKTGFEDGLFDGLDGNALLRIPTLRKSSSKNKSEENKEIKFEPLGEQINTEKKYEELLKELDSANKIIAQEAKSALDKDDKQSYLIKMREFFSDIANKYQQQHERSTILLVVATWIAILSLELLHNFHLTFLMFVYLVVVLSAFGYYYKFLNSGKTQDNFVFFRGLSEALRVQDAWEKSGVDDKVSKYYLKKQYSTLVWLKIALNNLHYVKKQYLIESVTPGIECVEKGCWIDDQVQYFHKAIKKRTTEYLKLERLNHKLHQSGLYFSIITFVLFLAYFFHFEIGLSHYTLGFLFHLGLFLSGMLLVTSAFIREKYSHLKGYKEEIYNFGIMSQMFKKAQTLLKRSEDSKDKKQIIRELGIEALEENSKWVSLHYNRKVKPAME